MKTVNQHDLLEKLEVRIQKHTKEVLDQFQLLDENALLKSSPTGGWSIVQCLDHLKSYGDYYLPVITRKLGKAKSENVDHFFKSSWLGAYFIQMMEPSTGTKKYKAFKGHIPADRPEPHPTIARFLNQQNMLLQLLESSKRRDLNRVRIPISITPLVRLKLGDVLQFIIAHNERHLVQAMRNLKVVNEVFPPVNN
jgi:uncharacterized damage-inducible protein DinB